MQFIAGICAPRVYNCFSQTYTYKGIYGHISRFEMTLGRTFVEAGRASSFVNADCPAPGHRSEALLALAELRLYYAGAFRPSQIATREGCAVLPRHHKRRKHD
jgi:hypothetical protein